MRLTKIAFAFFVITSVLHLLGELLYNQPLQTFTKPLLIPLLTLYFLTSVRFQFSRFNTAVSIGLFFSFLGDTLLLFADRQANLFIFGLLSFLVTHFCYLFAFSGYPGARRGQVIRHPWLVLPFLLFLIGYHALLLSSIPPELYFPVIFYSVAIITMSLSVLNLRQLISTPAFVVLFSGALLFVASDSILAFHKFQHQVQIPYVGFLIMLTYLLGQYLIVKGVIRIHTSQ